MNSISLKARNLILYSGKSFICFCFILNSSVVFSQGSNGWLYTQGNKIYRSDNTVFSGRGANIFDTRLCVAGTYSAPDVAEVNRRTDKVVDVWHANFLRLCLESYASLGESQVHGLSVLKDATYLNDIVEIVKHIGTKENVYVLVSLWIDPSLDNMGWPTDQTIDVWRVLTQRLAQYPYVLFGICDEPRLNWDGSLDAQVWQRMNAVVAAIRDEEQNLGSSKHVIIVQGTGGWAKRLDYYINHPITAGGGTNIAYEVHVYDSQSAFNSIFIGPSSNIPVLIGAFGPLSGYMTLVDCQVLMDNAESLQIPYLAWAFHQRSSPSLLVDPTGSGPGIGMELVPTDWGELLKDQLLLTVDFQEQELSPQKFLQNYPNPFSASTTITFEVPEVSHYRLTVYDYIGQGITVLVNETKSPGTYLMEWDGTNSDGHRISRGVYFLQLKGSNGFAQTRKMVIMD